MAILAVIMLLSITGCGEEETELEIMELPMLEETNASTDQPSEDAEKNATEDETTEELNETEEADEPEIIEEDNETVDITEEEVTELEAAEVITIFDFAPHPDYLEISIGTTVTWVNEDENFQHIIGWSKMPVKVGVIPPGMQWNHTFTEPGEIIWYSTPKPTVQGTIVINE